MHFLMIKLCVVLGVFYTHGASISTEYGVPNKPFDKYGPPEDTPAETLSDASSINQLPKAEEIPIPETVGGIVGETPETRTVPEKLPKGIPIHKTDTHNQYAVGFDSPDGTEVREEGRLISTDDGWEYVVAKTGSYKYTSPEGKLVEVEWAADEKGFRILSSTV